MKCECEKYEHLEPNRHSIYKRIQETDKLRKTLKMIAEKRDENNFLYECSICNQFWQESLAWNWNCKKYLFKVPKIDVENWLCESFVEPDKILIHTASLENYEKNQTFNQKNEKCRNEKCSSNAIQYSIFCKNRHIESLQKSRVLPAFPKGRFFEPYQ